MRLRNMPAVTACLVLLVLAVVVLTGRVRAQPPESNPKLDLIEALREIVEVRTEQFERTRRLFEAEGRVSHVRVAASECDLLEARIRLFLAENEKQQAIEHARRIVELRRQMLEALQKGPDRVSADAFYQARIDLAESRVRLAELRTK